MLRQIHIFQKNEELPLFSYSYAMALGEEELRNIVDIIKSYIDMPMPGKTFERPFTNFQIFHRSSENYTFLFVTDLIDQKERVEKPLKAVIAKFDELFKYPKEIDESQVKRNQFIDFIEPLQPEFHSKISIIGPIDAGKTTLYSLLSEGEEKLIMNFAKVSKYSINNLSFDIWNFQLKDNFSLLWSKFISGSDLVILLFDLSNYRLRVIEHFRSLIKKEAKLSKVLIIGNKRDLVEDADIKFIKNELEIDDFIEISLKEPEAVDSLKEIISKAMNLRKSLPNEYSRLLAEAKELESKSNFVMTIAKYKEIIKLCNQYQNLNLVKQFKDKVATLQAKVDERNQLRKLKESRKKFEIPDRIKFNKRIQVKPLPPSGSTQEVPKPKRSFQSFGDLEKSKKAKSNVGELTLFEKSEKSEDKRFLSPSDVSIEFKAPEEQKLQSKSLVIEEKLEGKLEEGRYPEELQKLIIDRGSSLSIDLCKQLITDLQKAMARPLSEEDLEMAAEIFVKNELKV